MVTLDDVCFGTIEGPAGALHQLSTTHYREGDRRDDRRCDVAAPAVPATIAEPTRAPTREAHAMFARRRGWGMTVLSAYGVMRRGV